MNTKTKLGRQTAFPAAFCVNVLAGCIFGSGLGYIPTYIAFQALNEDCEQYQSDPTCTGAVHAKCAWVPLTAEITAPTAAPISFSSQNNSSEDVPSSSASASSSEIDDDATTKSSREEMAANQNQSQDGSSSDSAVDGSQQHECVHEYTVTTGGRKCSDNTNAEMCEQEGGGSVCVWANDKSVCHFQRGFDALEIGLFSGALMLGGIFGPYIQMLLMHVFSRKITTKINSDDDSNTLGLPNGDGGVVELNSASSTPPPPPLSAPRFRPVMVTLGVLALVGNTITTVSRAVNSFPVLILGRFVFGAVAGAVQAVAPNYAFMITTPPRAAVCVATVQGSISVGAMMMTLYGYFARPQDGDYAHPTESLGLESDIHTLLVPSWIAVCLYIVVGIIAPEPRGNNDATTASSSSVSTATKDISRSEMKTGSSSSSNARQSPPPGGAVLVAVSARTAAAEEIVTTTATIIDQKVDARREPVKDESKAGMIPEEDRRHEVESELGSDFDENLGAAENHHDHQTSQEEEEGKEHRHRAVDPKNDEDVPSSLLTLVEEKEKALQKKKSAQQKYHRNKNSSTFESNENISPTSSNTNGSDTVVTPAVAVAATVVAVGKEDNGDKDNDEASSSTKNASILVTIKRQYKALFIGFCTVMTFMWTGMPATLAFGPIYGELLVGVDPIIIPVYVSIAITVLGILGPFIRRGCARFVGETDGSDAQEDVSSLSSSASDATTTATAALAGTKTTSSSSSNSCYRTKIYGKISGARIMFLIGLLLDLLGDIIVIIGAPLSHTPTRYAVCTAGFLLLLVGSGCFIGTVFYELCIQLFPKRYQAAGSAMCVSLLMIANAAINILFPMMVASFGGQGDTLKGVSAAFGVMLGVGCLGGIVTVFFLHPIRSSTTKTSSSSSPTTDGDTTAASATATTTHTHVTGAPPSLHNHANEIVPIVTYTRHEEYQV